MESKSAIVERLYFALRATRAGRDIIEMSYEKNYSGEFVEIVYVGGTIKRVDVTADSGLALIYDVVEAIK